MQIYLDNASTTKVCQEAAEAALRAMTEVFGNPSSDHSVGRMANEIIKDAREKTAKALDCESQQLFFTSCGTESDNWAIINGARYNFRAGRHIISSGAEHDAVLRPLDILKNEGFEVTLLKPRSDGGIDPEKVAAALRGDTCLVTLMTVNNETGAITDILQTSKLLKAQGSKALLHTDAVQAFMKIPFSAAKCGADMVSVSGHKIHAPKGIGALYIKSGLNLPPFLAGGKQEGGKRAGTENVPHIAAFGEASRIASENFDENRARMKALSHYIRQKLSELGILTIGEGSSHIISMSMPGYQSQVIMNALDAQGICVSRSSACKKGGRSHVLEAIGLKPNVIDGALRLSISRFTTVEEIDVFIRAIAKAQLLRHR